MVFAFGHLMSRIFLVLDIHSQHLLHKFLLLSSFVFLIAILAYIKSTTHTPKPTFAAFLPCRTQTVTSISHLPRTDGFIGSVPKIRPSCEQRPKEGGGGSLFV
ncbi:uncharacterized protein TrAtP1_003528 [Trichoderma atroviride]|uniref:uncharacterized protein n=1 Tax=Hypocrea atroviridis TaxID=63577 RepID=UPI00331EF1D6|nr:hypothetical protein TrAtP1_003528 [Trichoderma atroviride]